MAEIAQLVHDNFEWKILGFESFDSWIASACRRSRSHVRDNMKLVTDLKQDVPIKDLKQIPHSTAKVMRMLPAKDRKEPAILKKAKSSQPREFVNHVLETKPELHIEKLAWAKYNFTESQKKVVVAAIQAAKLIEGDEDISDEMALEKICAHFLLYHQRDIEDAAGTALRQSTLSMRG